MVNSSQINLTDSNAWALKWEEFTLAPFTLISPVFFQSLIIAVEIDNPEKLVTWKYAGMLAQKAELTAFGKGMQPIAWVKLFLNSHILIEFNFIPTTGYKLEFIPASWHKQIIIKAWEYAS